MILRRAAASLLTVFAAALLVFAVPAGQAFAGTVPPPVVIVSTSGTSVWTVPFAQDLFTNTKDSISHAVSGCNPYASGTSVGGCLGASLESLGQMALGYNVGKSALSASATAVKWFFTGDDGSSSNGPTSPNGDSQCGVAYGRCLTTTILTWPSQPADLTEANTCDGMQNGHDEGDPTRTGYDVPSCGQVRFNVTYPREGLTNTGGYDPHWPRDEYGYEAAFRSTCRPVQRGSDSSQDVTFDVTAFGVGFTYQGSGEHRQSIATCNYGLANLHLISGTINTAVHYQPVGIVFNGLADQGGHVQFTWDAPWGHVANSTPPPADTPVHQKVTCLKPDGTFYEVESDGVLGVMGSTFAIPLCDASGQDSAGRPRDLMCQYDLSTSKPQQSVKFCGDDGANAQPQYPLCGGTARCDYSLWVDGWVCKVGKPECVSWTKTYAADPSRTVCHWGPYKIDLGKCGFLERAYEVNGPSTLCPENVDGDPATSCGTTPPTSTVPPVPAPPAGSGQTGGASCTPSSTSGGAGCGQEGAPVTPDNSSSCYPSGWGVFNPLEWIVRPMKCVLTWALVPDASAVSDAFKGLGDVWKTSPPGAVVTAVTPVMVGIGSGFSAASSCGSMPDFSVPGASIHLPCTMAAVGPGSAIYTLVQAVLVVTTAVYLWGMVSGMLGAPGGQE